MCIISSLPVRGGHADVAQQVERILGKDEVTSSNLVISSSKTTRPVLVVFWYVHWVCGACGGERHALLFHTVK